MKKIKENLERIRELVRELAYGGRDYYVALREADGNLTCGFASMEYAESHGCLPRALYYEVWNPQGECVKAVVVNHNRLSKLGGYSLPLQCVELPPPCSLVANPFEQDEPAASNPTPLWWEVERAEKARKLDELIALRRELRAMLNYD